ncbi:MAG: hypothetical protein MUC51_06250 [Anaerolineae bacterium]|jgi:hypothetical protein|nr:hypothetical protein [Anaerolineae bacterium]
MAERKHTPDVLADILGAASPVEAPAGATAPPAPRPPGPPAAPAKRTQRAEPGPRWKYRIVSFQDYHGWRPRFENGVEIAGWMRGPLLNEFLEQAGEDGWELAAASAGESLYGSSDKRQLYLKRAER